MWNRNFIVYASLISGLSLLGFKAKEEVKRHYHVKPASFIYPDESVSSAIRLLIFLILVPTANAFHTVW